MGIEEFEPDGRSLPSRFEITKPQFMAEQERAYWTGFDHGEWVGRHELREQIRVELQNEMECFDPDCPLCVARRDLDELGRRLKIVALDNDERRSRARGWAIRGGRYPYRETRAR